LFRTEEMRLLQELDIISQPDVVLNECSSDGPSGSSEATVWRNILSGELRHSKYWSQCLAIWSSYYRSKVAESVRSTLGNVEVH
jgi:hypothetical protein